MKKTIFLSLTLLLTITSVSAENLNDSTNQIDSTFNSINDPFESINRKVFSFNKQVDNYGIKPIAIFYKNNTPKPIQSKVSNFVNYLETPIHAINFGLQGNTDKLSDTLGRFILNTLGLGILDFATEANIPNHKTTFGETLGLWGVSEGPYIVLPILGGNSLRDTSSNLAFDSNYNLNNNFNNTLKYSSIGLKVIDTRKNLLNYDNLINEYSFDEYSFVKNAIINKKRNNIENIKIENNSSY